MIDIAEYFNRSEFTCKCGCGKNNISALLVSNLDELRACYGEEIIITSGCRCRKYNKIVGGSLTSAHLTGLAVDIEVCDSYKRSRILYHCLSMFMRVGVARSFIHVDMDYEKPHSVCWVYK